MDFSFSLYFSHDFDPHACVRFCHRIKCSLACHLVPFPRADSRSNFCGVSVCKPDMPAMFLRCLLVCVLERVKQRVDFEPNRLVLLSLRANFFPAWSNAPDFKAQRRQTLHFLSSCNIIDICVDQSSFVGNSLTRLLDQFCRPSPERVPLGGEIAPRLQTNFTPFSPNTRYLPALIFVVVLQ